MSPRHRLRRPHHWRRRLTIGAVAALVPAIVGLVAGSARGSTVNSASFSGGAGTVAVGGTLYAKNGGVLTLTVTTSADTKCVDVSGAFTGHQTSSTAKSTWTFATTAGSGNGPQQATAIASPSFNTNDKCTGQPSNPISASYVLDNAGPVVAAAVQPTPNSAGWNNSNVTVAWSATDAGSGVASGPTPATDSVTANTSGVTRTATATDRLGNAGSGSVTVKLDKSAPSIAGSRSPAANQAGWNNTDVTVSFTCSDSPAGVKSCTGSTVLNTNGANQSVTGTAVDNADNTATATVGGINIDKVPPTLTGAPATAPNAAGWYNGDVTVHWAAGDALSGLAGPVPADSLISSEGTGLTASAAVADKAGNTTTASSSPVNVDRTAPTTSANAPADWNNTDVTVSLTAGDALSGVAGTFYTLDGGAQQTGTSVSISAEADHSLVFWSTDKAGNVETAHTVHVKIDKTPPTIDHTQSPAANAHGWNNTDVIVTFTCADAGSGIASCTGPQTVTTEGAAQPVTGTATDHAGNTTTDPATVSIDKTAPTVTAGTGDNPVRNANGWFNDDVTVNFTCADDRSGIDTCPAPVTLHEGADQSATGTATDAAGNTSQPASLTGINVDKTPPMLHGTPTTGPGPDGWYRGDVTIAWTCSDNLSGTDGDCPADSTITGEGANTSTTATVTDMAGNTTTVTVGGIKIDRTAPNTVASVPQPLDTGWYATDVAVTLNGVDPLSGVAKTFYTIDGGSPTVYSGPFTVGAGVHTVAFWSVDTAGNVEDAATPGHSLTLMVDGNPPTITGTASPAPNLAGWNNTPVTVTFACNDAESGIQTCPDPVTLTADGANQHVTGTAVDKAGNSASVTVQPVNIDRTKPVITIGGVADGGKYTLGAVPQATCTAADVVSGVDGACTIAVSGGLANGVGTYTYTATATDKAGNVAVTTGSYRVVYKFSGFQQPINDPAVDPSLATSIFKGGSTVPTKFRLTDANGVVVQANSAPAWLTPAKGAPTTQAVDENAYSDPATSGATYRWDATSQQYIYNWSTKGSATGYYYRVSVQLDDGETYSVTVGLR